MPAVDIGPCSQAEHKLTAKTPPQDISSPRGLLAGHRKCIVRQPRRHAPRAGGMGGQQQISNRIADNGWNYFFPSKPTCGDSTICSRRPVRAAGPARGRMRGAARAAVRGPVWPEPAPRRRRGAAIDRRGTRCIDGRGRPGSAASLRAAVGSVLRRPAALINLQDAQGHWSSACRMGPPDTRGRPGCAGWF